MPFHIGTVSRWQAYRSARLWRALFRKCEGISEPEDPHRPSIGPQAHRAALLRAALAQNGVRLHSEDSEQLAPKKIESACRIVDRFWKTHYKAQTFQATSARLMALDTLDPTTKDPGRGGVGDTARGLPHRGIFKGDIVPLKWSFASFSSRRKGWAGGVRGRPERPFRRDLQGPIDHIPVKPAASNISAPLEQSK